MGFSRRSFAVSFYAVMVSLMFPRATRSQPSVPPSGPYALEPLPYDYGALEPFIDRETMKVHHDKHYAAYAEKLNAAVEKYPELQKKSAEDLLRNLKQVPEPISKTVRNHGGGYVNHTMFWQMMKPQGGGAPTGPIADAIKSNFGSFETFKTQFNEAGQKQFGSGWVWLVRKPDNKLEITTTANQDSPLSDGLYPVMCNDLWEHAYYLKYQNRRAEYLKSWWNVVNWDEINRRYERAVRA